MALTLTGLKGPKTLYLSFSTTSFTGMFISALLVDSGTLGTLGTLGAVGNPGTDIFKRPLTR
ncbi:MAG: hypothetical protein WCO60_11445 [Verrucomicrobiota bacterium]